MTDPCRITIRSVRRRGQWYTVHTDTDDDAATMHAEVVVKYAIAAGKRFAAERWRELVTEAAGNACYHRLLGLLAQRPHTDAELRRKLRQRGFNAAIIATAVDKATTLGLAGDAEFARLFVEEKLRGGGLGRYRIVADLRRRGVARELIDAAFAATAADAEDADLEWHNALRAARLKWRALARESDPQRRKRRLLSFLAGRGFSADLCYRAHDACRRDDAARQ